MNLSLKTIYYYFLIFILTCSIKPLQISAQESKPCIPGNMPFNHNEQLTYTVAYNWFVIFADVGFVNLTTNLVSGQSGKLLHLKATGKTTETWDKMYRVRDLYESFVDPETLQPVFYNRNVDEGGYKIDINYNYNQDDKLAYSKTKVNDKPVKLDTIEFPDCINDIVSIIYYTRTIDFSKQKPGNFIELPLLLDNKVYDVKLEYLGIDERKIKNFGKIKCHKYTTSVISGTVFEEGDKIFIWASADKNQIPVYAESPIIVGKVKVRLTSYSGLKYSLKFK